MAREIFHGKRVERRQRYRQGQNDQLGPLGLVTDIVILRNTIYAETILHQFRRESHPWRGEDVARLSPFVHQHINLLGRYSFILPEAVERAACEPSTAPKMGLKYTNSSIAPPTPKLPGGHRLDRRLTSVATSAQAKEEEEEEEEEKRNAQ